MVVAVGTAKASGFPSEMGAVRFTATGAIDAGFGTAGRTTPSVTPGDHLGDVIGDINRRRGTIQEQIERGNNIAVVATVPLSEMFGYIGQLRSMTSGRASYTMEFSHYHPVPKNVSDVVIADVAKARQAANA